MIKGSELRVIWSIFSGVFVAVADSGKERAILWHILDVFFYLSGNCFQCRGIPIQIALLHLSLGIVNSWFCRFGMKIVIVLLQISNMHSLCLTSRWRLAFLFPLFPLLQRSYLEPTRLVTTYFVSTFCQLNYTAI